MLPPWFLLSLSVTQTMTVSMSCHRLLLLLLLLGACPLQLRKPKNVSQQRVVKIVVTKVADLPSQVKALEARAVEGVPPPASVSDMDEIIGMLGTHSIATPTPPSKRLRIRYQEAC